MRSLDEDVYAAVLRGEVVARDFLWMEPRDRATNARVGIGVWSDFGPITAPMIDGITGAVVSRSFTGSGSLIEISAIPLVNDLRVETVSVQVSQIADAVQLAIRGYDPDQAPVEIHRGFYAVETRTLIAPAMPLFVGFIDTIEIVTPPEGEDGRIELTLASHARELTRTNTQKRSDEDQKRRDGDRFYQYTAVSGDWEFWWGSEGGARVND